MKISASIYSNKKASIVETVKELEKYNFGCLHIDCNDDISVFEDIVEIKKFTKTPIDLHLITSNPQKYYQLIKDNKINQLTFQFENLPDNYDLPVNLAPKVGIAIMNDTPIDVFEKFKDAASHILFMTTTPGVSGGVFNKFTFTKIRQFRNRFSDKEIHVDGGVNDKVSFILRNMGVQCAVIGSFLFKNHLGYSLLRLQNDDVSSGYTAEDFMMNIDEIPVLKEGKFTFLELLQTIESFKMGLAIISNNENKLVGLVTNADIRKALIKDYENIYNINISSIINRTPVVVNKNTTVEGIIKLIKKIPFPIQFLPVIDEDKSVRGLLRFNNLIKGEL